jgi:hypothetical protein
MRAETEHRYARKCLHALANQMQLVLSHMEYGVELSGISEGKGVEEFEKARKAMRRSAAIMADLQSHIAVLLAEAGEKEGS